MPLVGFTTFTTFQESPFGKIQVFFRKDEYRKTDKSN